MMIREWRIGTRDVFVDGRMVAVLNGVGDTFEVWEFDDEKRMTTGKCFGRMDIAGLVEMYGPLEDEGHQTSETRKKVDQQGSEQMNLFGKVCECGQTATIVQQTLYGDELYCDSCYDDMVREKERD